MIEGKQVIDGVVEIDGMKLRITNVTAVDVGDGECWHDIDFVDDDTGKEVELTEDQLDKLYESEVVEKLCNTSTYWFDKGYR